MNTLGANKDKEFVNRILNPQQSPPVIQNNDGTISSHLMAYSGIDGGRGVVYPTIVNVDGKLTKLGDRDAIEYAKRTGEAIIFKTEKEAEEFSLNYKLGLGK